MSFPVLGWVSCRSVDLCFFFSGDLLVGDLDRVWVFAAIVMVVVGGALTLVDGSLEVGRDVVGAS